MDNMAIHMLKAIDKMLESSEETKVVCAREVLIELSQHLEEEAKVVVPESVLYDGHRTHVDDVDLDQEAKEAERELSQ